MQKKNRMFFVETIRSSLHAWCGEKAYLYVKSAKLLQVFPRLIVAFNEMKQRCSTEPPGCI